MEKIELRSIYAAENFPVAKDFGWKIIKFNKVYNYLKIFLIPSLAYAYKL